MIIKLAQPEEGGNFTGWETEKRTVLFAIDSASVLMNRQRVFPVGNWVCVSPLLCQSLQPSLHSVTKTVTPFLLACATHTSLKLTCQCPPSKSSFSATDHFSQRGCWQCRSESDASRRGRAATFQKACSPVPEPKEPTL